MIESGPQELPVPTASEPRHVLALDGLRGVAILLVLIHHSSILLNQAAAEAGASMLDRFMGFWAYGGWSGVDLFFVLSGFLITGILYDTRGARNYYLVFYARRILRIFPLYYAVLAMALIVVPRLPFALSDVLGSIDSDDIWYWLYLSNFAIAVQHTFRHGIDISWSLAIEEQFYLVWPLIVLQFDRRRLMAICGGLVLLALGWRLVLLVAGVHPVSVYVLTLSRVDALAIGAFIALAIRGSSQPSTRRRWAINTGIVSAVALILMAVARGGFDPHIIMIEAPWGKTTSQWANPMQIIGYTCFAFFYGSLLTLAVDNSARSWFVRLLEQPLLRTYGKYSYAIYLFHLPIRTLLWMALFGPTQPLAGLGHTLPGQLLFVLAAVAVPLGPAWLSWQLFEKQFLKFRRFFRYDFPGESFRPAGDTHNQEPSLGLLPRH